MAISCHNDFPLMGKHYINIQGVRHYSKVKRELSEHEALETSGEHLSETPSPSFASLFPCSETGVPAATTLDLWFELTASTLSQSGYQYNIWSFFICSWTGVTHWGYRLLIWRGWVIPTRALRGAFSSLRLCSEGSASSAREGAMKHEQNKVFRCE